MSIRLHVQRWGQGPRVVLVHGGVLGGREAWRAQRPLTARWTLLAPDRPGHGRSPSARQDFESEAVLVADQLLDCPAHLVGLSYGAIVAMYAAARRPGNVLSLTIIEPPSTAVARGIAEADDFGRSVRQLLESTDLAADVALRRFVDLVGAWVDLDDPPAPVLLSGMRQLLGARPPDEADPPLDQLRAAGFPALVVSGGHQRVNEIICDRIAERTAATRVVLPGTGHLVPDQGEPFNRVLEQFLYRAEQDQGD